MALVQPYPSQSRPLQQWSRSSLAFRKTACLCSQPIQQSSSTTFSSRHHLNIIKSRLRGGKGGVSRRTGDRNDDKPGRQQTNGSEASTPAAGGMGSSSTLSAVVGHVVFNNSAGSTVSNSSDSTVWRRRNSSLDAAGGAAGSYSPNDVTSTTSSGIMKFADTATSLSAGALVTPSMHSLNMVRCASTGGRNGSMLSSTTQLAAATGPLSPAHAFPSASIPSSSMGLLSDDVSFRQSSPRKSSTAAAAGSSSYSPLTPTNEDITDVIPEGPMHLVADHPKYSTVPIRMVNPSVMLHSKDSTIYQLPSVSPTAVTAIPPTAAAAAATASIAARPAKARKSSKSAKKPARWSDPSSAGGTGTSGNAKPVESVVHVTFHKSHKGTSSAAAAVASVASAAATVTATAAAKRAPASATGGCNAASNVANECEHKDELDVYRGLVLDCAYRPINVVCWKRALTLEIAEKADVLEYYDAVVNSATQAFPIPAVLRVSSFVHVPKQRRRRVSLSRSSIFLRDKFRCMYCGCREQLTIDHVVPLSRGGGSSWENLATACSPCNLRKANRTPAEASMKLLSVPKEPRELDTHDLPPNYRTYRTIQRFKAAPREWLDWLPLQPHQKRRQRHGREGDKDIGDDEGWIQDQDPVAG